MEVILEELYELLDLYFTVDVSIGTINTFQKCMDVEPALDRLILKEDILNQIIKVSQQLHIL